MDDYIQSLINEQENIRMLPEEEVCSMYNVDYKEEAIQAIQEEIDFLQKESNDYDYDEYELERERDALCMSLGIPRYC